MPLNYAWCSDFAKQNVAGTRRGEQCGMFSEDLHFKEQRRERERFVFTRLFLQMHFYDSLVFSPLSLVSVVLPLSIFTAINFDPVPATSSFMSTTLTTSETR